MKFPKSIAVIYSNSSDGSGKGKMKNIHDSWKEVISTFTRVWKKLISSRKFIPSWGIGIPVNAMILRQNIKQGIA
jgi:hypothetical protein